MYNNYEEYSINAWGGYPPPMLPSNKQYPREGKITFNIPDNIKKNIRNYMEQINTEV